MNPREPRAIKLIRLGFWLVVLAAAVFLPPVKTPKPLDLRVVNEAGKDEPCPPTFAFVERPDRRAPYARALLDDFAYAAADAGPVGAGVLLACFAFIVWFFGCMTRGLRCGLRRLLLAFALGVPITLGLLYVSCFLDGRAIRLGAEAGDWIPASLHNQTNTTTGLLSPSDVVSWHYRRGFRVINVSDRDTTDGGRAAREYALRKGHQPSLTVLVGEEWHGHPDIVLVNVKRDWKPHAVPMDELLAGVRKEGGASFVAHPWSKLDESLEALLARGVDGVEVVNGRIHGGTRVLDAARLRDKTLLGTIDYKFGPHVNAITVLPAETANSPAKIVAAIRARRTRVLYAVPGGAVTGEAWDAHRLGLTSAAAGLHALLQTPRPRRLVWFLWLALGAILWRITTWRDVAAEATGKARLLFLVCCVLQFAIP
ncbi:MAG: hypothetical protein OER88_14165, partial [Planctomycetota bacterium]|nr:hypothetical protein [Planctomycetota bacterium]